MQHADPASRRVASRQRGVSPTTLFGGAGVVVAALLGVAVFWFTDLRWFWNWIIAWSGATFLLYAVDKFEARIGRLRVPESVLHALALIGGAPGGWAGMALVRHKIRHPIFSVVLALGTLVDVALVWSQLTRA